MPARLGRYAVRRRIGSGGFATVWLAYDEQLDAPVAVKVLAENWTEDGHVRQRFLEEGRYLRRVESPHVVTVYDAGELDDGRPYLVMTYADQGTLADRLGVVGLTPAQALVVAEEVGAGLQALHRRGVLHRDVKPANVLICSDGRCVLTDFGVARMPTDVQLTTPGMVLGSPHFISPERAMGHPFGPPSDLFSLGVTLYTAVEGRPPFDKGDPIETMHAVVEDPPTPAVRAGSLTPVLMGLLEKDPARRFDVQTARTMLR